MKHILDFYKYNSYVRKKYLDAYRYWFEFAISGLKVREYKDVDPSDFGSVAEMRKYEEQVDSTVLKLVQGLREEDLPKVYTVYSTELDDPETLQISLETILMHMIEEELQHRGELNCLFWQSDRDPPITGFDKR